MNTEYNRVVLEAALRQSAEYVLKTAGNVVSATMAVAYAKSEEEAEAAKKRLTLASFRHKVALRQNRQCMNTVKLWHSESTGV